MNRERLKRERKAYQRGREARRAGEPLESNPLRLSAWRTGEEWERGWHEQDEELKA